MVDEDPLTKDENALLIKALLEDLKTLLTENKALLTTIEVNTRPA